MVAGVDNINISQCHPEDTPIERNEPIGLPQKHSVDFIDGHHVPVTEAESRGICRKIDRVILVILVCVYSLQVLDKSVLAYGATFGLKTDTHLKGNQYSLVGSAAPIAQLFWQPFSSVLIVKVPHRILMPLLCLGWGLAQASMAACSSFGGLVTTRFFLGIFEGGCLPLFSVITSQWYRRAEQPLRIAAWYSTNGAATIIGAALSYGLGSIKSPALREWQIIFLFVGLVTVAFTPFVYWKLDNDIPSARFLTERERLQAIERLRANQTGKRSHEFKWQHIVETALEVKTYLWIAMAMCLNIGASVTSVFGPLIVKSLATDQSHAVLLNMPFGALQLLIILTSSYLAQKVKMKGVVLTLFMLPVVAGLAILLCIPHNASSQAPLLVGYYLLAFLFGGNPLIVTWIIGNTAGTTKQAVVMSVYNAASSAGNIAGPLLFNENEAPTYKSGLRSCLAIFAALVVIVLLQWVVLVFLNRLQEARRRVNGKCAKIEDRSMQSRYHDDFENAIRGSLGSMGHSPRRPFDPLGNNAFSDLTDRENDEFIYIY